MKKIKLIGMALLASTFGLTSCDVPEWLNWIPGLTPSDGQKDEKDSSDVKGEVVSVKINTSVEKITDETSPFKLGYKIVVNGEASKEVAWSSSDTSKARIAADGTVTPVLGASGSVTFTLTSVQDATKSDSVSIEIVTVPGVSAVAVNAPESVYLHSAEAKVEAVVAVKGSPNKGVTWSSSDPEVAAVDSKGNLTLYNAGTVTITATSNFDSSKSGSANIEVVDGGLHPELITESGFEYSKSWPEELVNSFAGLQVAPIEAEDGVYYAQSESSEESAASIVCVFESTEEVLSAISESLEDYFFFYDPYDEYYGFMDENHNVEFEVSFAALDEYSEVIVLSAYHPAEIYEGSVEATTDVAWSEDVQTAFDSLGVDIPFVALGADYDGYQYSDGTYEISDYSYDFAKLSGYEEVLLADGFEAVLDEYGDAAYYAKANDEYSSTNVSYYFCQYGNSIAVWRELTELDYYPEGGVSAFVEEMNTIYSVPVFQPESEGVAYTFDTFAQDFSEEEDGSDIRDVAEVAIFGASQEECEAYVEALVADGYEADSSSSVSEYMGVSQIALQKGKICVIAQIQYASRNATEAEVEAMLEAYEAIADLTDEEFAALTPEEQRAAVELSNQYYEWMINYLFSGVNTFTVYNYDVMSSAALYIYKDPHAMEVPGVYIYDEEATLAPEATLALEPIFYQMDEVEVSFASSDESVATVSAEGVVTAVALGDAEITVSAMNGDDPVSDTIVIHVVNKYLSIASYVAAANAIFAEMGVEEELVLPEPNATYIYDSYCGWDEQYQVYVINATCDLSPEEYAALLPADYEVFEDEEGDPIATNGVYVVSVYLDEYDDLMIVVYLYEEVPPVEGDTIVFAQQGLSNAEDVNDVPFTLGSGTTITFSKGSNNTTPKYYDTGTGIRVYGNNTITIVAPEGESLESVSIEMSQFNKAITCNVGTIEEGTDSITWTAPANCSSVTFTIESGSGHNRITTISVELAA